MAEHSNEWQTVTYPKRHRRTQPSTSTSAAAAATSNGDSHIFDNFDQKAHDRRRKLEAAAAAEAAADAEEFSTMPRSDDESGDDVKENGSADVETVKKVKEKKVKKPKVTVAEAAAKIDVSDLAAHLVEVTASYEGQQDIQLMRFLDYFGKAFAGVNASMFPWQRLLNESPVTKIIDIPMCHIPDAVYKTPAEWLSQRSTEALGSFVLWCLDSILPELAPSTASKGTKKHAHQPSSKSQVAIFVVLAMTLHRKPDLLIGLLPTLRENPKYQGHDKFPVIIWFIGQASQGDLVVGMYAWIHYLLPLVAGKSNVNTRSRDLALQLVERILSAPKARSILLNGAVRKGERLVSPSGLDLLMRVTFPPQSARIKATERFEAIYPTLKELALAGSPGTKTTKQAAQQLLPLCVKAIQENKPELTKEAADIFIWCLIQNSDCYKQWESHHLDNVDATIAVLRKLSDEWKEYSTKIAPFDSLTQTLKRLRAKNAQALSKGVDGSKEASIKEADKLCKGIIGKSSRGSACLKSSVFVLVAAAAVAYVASPELIQSLDLQKLQNMITSSLKL